jgi:hypothetical protein
MSENKHLDRQSQVGIIFLIGDALYIDATPLDQARVYGDFKIHEGGHAAWREQLGLDGEYDDYPRGRVAYDARTQEFALLADRCVLARREIVAEILRRLRLPASTKPDSDAHYRRLQALLDLSVASAFAQHQ